MNYQPADCPGCGAPRNQDMSVCEYCRRPFGGFPVINQRGAGGAPRWNYGWTDPRGVYQDNLTRELQGKK